MPDSPGAIQVSTHSPGRPPAPPWFPPGFVALAGAVPDRLLRHLWPATALGAVCGALAGAAATLAPVPGAAPLANLGPAATLAAVPAVLLGALIAWRRGEVGFGAGPFSPGTAPATQGGRPSGRGAASPVPGSRTYPLGTARRLPDTAPSRPAMAPSGPRTPFLTGRVPAVALLRARGASWLQIASLFSVQALPTLAAAALLSGCASLLTGALATAVAPHQPWPAALVAGLRGAAAAALVISGAGIAGFVTAALGDSGRHRARAAGLCPSPYAVVTEVLLVAVGLFIARSIAADAGAPVAGQYGGVQAWVFAGLPSAGAAGQATPAMLAAVGWCLALAGSGLLGGRILGAITRRVEAVRSPAWSAVPILTARAISRGTAARRLILLPSVAAAALALLVTGALGVRATNSALGDLNAGAPLRIAEQWSLTCPTCAPGRIVAPTFQEDNARLPGASDQTTVTMGIVPVLDVAGVQSALVAGIDTATFAKVADWRVLPEGPRLVADMRAAPDTAVVSSALAADAGLRPGDTLSTRTLPRLTVLAVESAWPGMGYDNGLWAVVPTGVLTSALEDAPQVGGGTLNTDLLLRPQGDTNVPRIMSLLRADGATVGAGDVTTTALPRWGLGGLPAFLAPECAALLLLGVLALLTPPSDAASLPRGEALLALAAEPETARARRRLRLVTCWFGVAWGMAAGTVAAPLFWAALRLGPAGVEPVPFVAVPAGLWAAAAILALGAVLLWRDGRSDQHLAVEPDPDPATRQPAADSPTTEAPEGAAAGRPSPCPRASAHSRGGPFPSAPVRALAMPLLAARRLSARWRRLPALAAGLLLAASVAAAGPLFTTGALTRVLQAGLERLTDRPPGALLITLRPQAGGSPTQVDLDRLGAVANRAGPSAGIAQTPPTLFLASGIVLAPDAAQIGQPGASGAFLQFDAIPGMAPHASFLQGGPPPAQPEADGTIDVAAIQPAVAALGLQFGQVYVVQGAGGAPVRFRLTGIFTEETAGASASFWPYLYLDHDVLVAPGIWKQMVLTKRVLPMQQATWYTVLDLADLSAPRVPAAMAGLRRFGALVTNAAAGAGLDISPYGQLQAFLGREATLGALLRQVGAPVIGLTLYFVILTAGLMMDGEAGEMAVLLSRGATPATVLGMYAIEWLVLAVPLAALAPLPAALFARVMGAADGFLRFGRQTPLPLIIQPRDFAYAGGAALLGVASALVPVAAALGRSIVAQRARTSRLTEAPLWQRAYLDCGAIAILVVGGWMIRGGDAGAAALAGDQALYLAPSLLLLAGGLLAVRLLAALLRGVDAVWGGALPPALSIPVRRLGRMPTYLPVVLLLCLTGGLGTFSAAAARTLDQNLVATVRYRVGAPLRLVQFSPCSDAEQGKLPTVCGRYGLSGPPPRQLVPFALNAMAPGVRTAGQMIELPVAVHQGGRDVAATLMLVDTTNFAQSAWWAPNLDPLPESRYLQLLESAPNAVLVSPGLSGAAGGTLRASLGGGPDATLDSVGTVDRWPGVDVAGPMVVAALSAAEPVFGVTCGPPKARGAPPPPCAGLRIVLLQLRRGASVAAIEQTLAREGLSTMQADVASQEEGAAIAQPEWAGQTGLLTIGFLIALAVTTVGYLLFASVVMRGQTGQLGLLRAMGVDLGTVLRCVAVEQGMAVVVGTVAGMGAGALAARWFLPLFAPAFTGAGSVPFVTLGPGPALWEVAGLVGLLLAAAITLLLHMLRRLHVGESIKLEA